MLPPLQLSKLLAIVGMLEPLHLHSLVAALAALAAAVPDADLPAASDVVQRAPVPLVHVVFDSSASVVVSAVAAAA